MPSLFLVIDDEMSTDYKRTSGSNLKRILDGAPVFVQDNSVSQFEDGGSVVVQLTDIRDCFDNGDFLAPSYLCLVHRLYARGGRMPPAPSHF